MVSSPARSSSRPQRFPENLFVLDNPRPEDKLTPQIFLAAGDGNIRSMKSKLSRPLAPWIGLEVLLNESDAVSARGSVHTELAEGLAREGKSLGEMTVNDPLHRRLGPLHFAAWSGKLEMCRFLIKDLHLDVNADADRDSSGVAEILLSRGANVDPMCELGTPLHYAAECGNVQMLDMLLQYQANPNRVVRLFYAPLTLAIFAHSLKCVELLIKAGADVNAGRPVTPLIIAAADGLADCVKCLLEAGADANIPDEIGRTPLEIAAIQGWKACVEILFPFTSRVTRFPDWSIDGIMQHDYKKCEGSALKAQGDAAFQAKDYPHASDLYTKAVETDPHDSTLYAKRSLCWLHMGEKDKAFNDANTYKGMDVDLSSSCHDQAAALILTKEYGLACKALLSGLKLDFGRGPIGEVSR
ncbi:hypothetical protein ACQ4PT_041997 [Festuca glaucescens]